MLWLHQIHQLRPSTSQRFAQLVRDQWIPAVAARPGTRLAWFATSTRAAVHGDEAVTIIGVTDGASLAQLGARIHVGDLTEAATALSSLRVGVQSRILEPLDYDPFAVTTVAEIPAEPVEGSSRSYMHDFVPPVLGNMRGYEDLMRERYMRLTEKDLSGIVLRASWRTVPGGGPVPEMFNLSEIRSPEALERLVTVEIPLGLALGTRSAGSVGWPGQEAIGGGLTLAAGMVLLAVPFLPAVLAGMVLLGVAVPPIVVSLTTTAQTTTPAHSLGRVLSAVQTSTSIPQAASTALGAGLATLLPYQALLTIAAAVLGGAALWLGSRQRFRVNRITPATAAKRARGPLSG